MADLSEKCLDIARRIQSGEVGVYDGAFEILCLVHDREKAAAEGMADRVLGAIGAVTPTARGIAA